jgi:hypothetical protein
MYRVQRINPFYCSKDFTHAVFGVLYIFTHFPHKRGGSFLTINVLLFLKVRDFRILCGKIS